MKILKDHEVPARFRKAPEPKAESTPAPATPLAIPPVVVKIDAPRPRKPWMITFIRDEESRLTGLTAKSGEDVWVGAVDRDDDGVMTAVSLHPIGDHGILQANNEGAP